MVLGILTSKTIKKMLGEVQWKEQVKFLLHLGHCLRLLCLWLP